MNWYEIALGVVLIAVSLLIIVFTLAQEQKGQGLSAAIMGDNYDTLTKKYPCRRQAPPHDAARAAEQPAGG